MVEQQDPVLLVGKVASNGVALETMLGSMFAIALRAPTDVGFMLSAQLGAMRTIELLKQFAKIDGAVFSGDDFDRWYSAAKAALQARNRVIHDPWVAEGEEATALTISIRLDRGGEVGSRTNDEVTAIVRQLAEVLEETARLISASGAVVRRSWTSTEADPLSRTVRNYL